jgi:GNAT superfamily N-acetyltransferase
MKSTNDFPPVVVGSVKGVGLFDYTDDKPKVFLAESLRRVLSHPPVPGAWDTPLQQWVNEESFIPIKQPDQIATHELGHALDYMSGWKHSTEDEIYNWGPGVGTKLTQKEENNGKYWLSDEKETFAELYSLAYNPNRGEDQRYFGGMTRERAEEVFAKALKKVREIKRFEFARRQIEPPSKPPTGWFVNDDGNLFALLNGMPYEVDVAGTPFAGVRLVPGTYADDAALFRAAGQRQKAWIATRARAQALLRGHFIQDPVTGLMAGSEPGPGHPEGTGSAGAAKPAGKTKKIAKAEDFRKEKIEIGGNVDKFIERWNDVIGEDPGEFKQKFLGGLAGSMTIGYQESQDKMRFDGNLYYDEKAKELAGAHGRTMGSVYGSYIRYADLDDHKAESGYLKLAEDMQGKGVAKILLKGNVEMYQEMGIKRVDVHADIDVGGHAWARYGYVPSQRSWRDLQSKLEIELNRISGGTHRGGGDASSWDELSSTGQDQAERSWKEDSYDEFYDSEVESWRESGQALFDAKGALASNYVNDYEWAKFTMEEWRKDTTLNVPFTDKQILDSINIRYDDRSGEGRADPIIDFDDKALDFNPPASFDISNQLPGFEPVRPHELLTGEMRGEIEKVLIDAFNKKAEIDADQIEPPDYLESNAREQMDDYWDQMDDDQRFREAKAQGITEGSGTTVGTGEISGDEEAGLRTLIESDDPRAIWPISDSKWGKKLLLDSDWNGALDLTDKDSMTRFKAYLANTKKSAPPPEYWSFD